EQVLPVVSHLSPRVGDLAEGAADDDGVADHRDGVDDAVEDMRGVVDRIGRDHDGMRGRGRCCDRRQGDSGKHSTMFSRRCVIAWLLSVNCRVGHRLGLMTRAQLDKRPDEVSAMFDRTARRYDLVNDVISLGQVRLWRKAVARAVDAGPGEVVLDLGAGTGMSTESFTGLGARAIASDFSLGMLQV